ncbi:WD40/YVTN/BNR-like repeat-containing protein [Kitasatospora sp. NPDC056138]|uniref:WD40/YVTN/BNR-like repeat-containing protein n=1 Tax=Kitasatospora sp. NPDC056138 TaxID=3345724 RepID=UPI0035E2A65C
MSETLLAVGTQKGLFLGRSPDRARWEFTGPHFPMNAVYSIGIDRREGRVRLLAGADSSHWGPSVWWSDDLGASWQEPPRPAVRFPGHTGTSLERVWQLQPAGAEAPGVVYAGTQPAALFRSEDGGESFALDVPLWSHPHRKDWAAGFGGQGLHTIVTDPRDADALTVAVSTGGVYRTSDGGRNWHAANNGIRAAFLPNEYPEFGQCVHKVAADPVDRDRLYLQNHGGVYRSDDGGGHWQDVGSDLPATFGFGVAAHPRKSGTAYLFPLDADYARLPAARRCRVFRTRDAGASWHPLSDGLPAEDHYGVVLRDALCTDDGEPAGVYFGNRNGEVYGSADEGDSWALLTSHLPDVLCVRAAELS